MKLGILVNSDRHPEHVLGIAQAGADNGHDVSVFVMDDGVLLFGTPTFEQLVGLASVSLSVCRHSAERLGIAIDSIPESVTRGSQFENALLVHGTDRMIVL